MISAAAQDSPASPENRLQNFAAVPGGNESQKGLFLKHIVRLLNLTDTVVLHERVENLLQDARWKEFFDVLISRAAFKLPEMLPWGLFLKPSGRLIALKGSDMAAEFSQAEAVAAQHGFGQLFQYDVNQETSDITRKIIIGEKRK